MTSLDRAVAFAEVNDVAVRVGEHLDLDVARILQVALDVDRRIREVRPPLAPGRLERALDLLGRANDLEAFTASTRGGLDRNRPAELVAEPEDFLGAGDRLSRSGDDRDACGLHPLPRCDLRAHHLDCLRRRADPDEPRLLDCTGEGHILGEEPVAGVDRLGPAWASGVEHAFLRQIALGRAAPGPADRPRRRARRAASRGRPRSTRRRARSRAPEACGRCGSRSRRGLRRAPWRRRPRQAYSPWRMGLADQLTVARVALAPIIVVLYVVDFSGHDYWATALFAVAMATDWFDGRIGRRSGRASAWGRCSIPWRTRSSSSRSRSCSSTEGSSRAGWSPRSSLGSSSSRAFALRRSSEVSS